MHGVWSRRLDRKSRESVAGRFSGAAGAFGAKVWLWEMAFLPSGFLILVRSNHRLSVNDACGRFGRGVSAGVCLSFLAGAAPRSDH